MRISKAANSRTVTIEKRDGEPSRIVGYAAVFYHADEPGTEYELYNGHVERIQPGAFTRAIDEADDVRGLFNHEPSQILGRTASGTMRLSEDPTGLRYEIDIPDTQIGRDVATSIERGDVTGSSFAFSVSEGGSQVRKDGTITVREISGVDLFDAGPVTYPAYSASSTGLRAIDGMDDARAEIEAFHKQQQAVAVRLRMLALEFDT